MPDLGPMTEWQEWDEQQQEAEQIGILNGLLRAARDGTIYDPRDGEDDSRVEVNR